MIQIQNMFENGKPDATMIQIQDMFENGKPDIVLKTPFMILIYENSLKFGIVVIVMLNKMLVIVLLSTCSLDMGRGILKNRVFQFVPVSNI